MVEAKKVKWRHYQRDDTIVFRANDSTCEYFCLGRWMMSTQHSNETELLKHQGDRLDAVTPSKARRLTVL